MRRKEGRCLWKNDRCGEETVCGSPRNSGGNLHALQGCSRQSLWAEAQCQTLAFLDRKMGGSLEGRNLAA